MKYITKECPQCNKKFDALIKEHRRGNAKFCSRSCGSKFNNRLKQIPNTTCSYCNKSFYRKASKKNTGKSGLLFCCREHKDLAQRIKSGFPEIQPSHYGDGTRSCKYRDLAFKNLPHQCNTCGWNNYIEVLLVHHIDHNRSNNNLSNLEILCPTCHDMHHYLTKSGRFTL